MFERKCIGLAIVLALLPLASAAEEMTNADREARCANNLARLTPLEKKYGSYASDEEIARLRVGLENASAALADWHANSATLERYAAARNRLQQAWDRLKSLVRDPCSFDAQPDICLGHVQDELSSRIDDGRSQIPERDALGREIAAIRSRMIELQCPSNTSVNTQPGWNRVGSGDCPGQDEASTSGPMPDPSMCTQERAGKAAVCWDGDTFKNPYGETHGAPNYPWCTYKSTGSCGGGENTGALYYCRP